MLAEKLGFRTKTDVSGTSAPVSRYAYLSRLCFARQGALQSLARCREVLRKLLTHPDGASHNTFINVTRPHKLKLSI